MFELRLENRSGAIVNINDEVNYEILHVSGLTPPPASVFSSKSPNRKGRKKNGSTLDYRAIVIQIKLLGDIEYSRNALYPWIDTEEELKIYYRNTTKNVFCEGTVTECDIDLFTDNEVINLAIECDNPYWHDLEEISAGVTAVLKQFTFPFAIAQEGVTPVPTKQLNIKYNEGTGEIEEEYYVESTSYVNMNRGIPLSTVGINNETQVYNSGAETGCKITITCKEKLSNLRIYDATDTTRQFKINHEFTAGYVIEIDTEHSPKTVKAIAPDGNVENILKYVAENPTWFTLKKGENVFGYTADGGAADAEFIISFRNKYLGV